MNSIKTNSSPSILDQIKNAPSRHADSEIRMQAKDWSEYWSGDKTKVVFKAPGSSSLWGRLTACFGGGSRSMRTNDINKIKEDFRLKLEDIINESSLGENEKEKLVASLNENQGALANFDTELEPSSMLTSKMLTSKMVITFVDGKLADLKEQVKKALEAQNTTVNPKVTEQDNKKSKAGVWEMITSFVSGSKTEETPGRITSNDPVAPAGVNSKKNTKNTPQIENNKVENPVIINPKLDVVLDETHKTLLKRGERLEGVKEEGAELHGKAVEFKSLTSALVEKLKKK